QTVSAVDTVSSSLAGTTNSVTVSASTASHFVVTASPGNVTAGGTVSVTVTALDAFNNTATGYAGLVHFSSTDTQATLPANSALTRGVGVFNATLRTAGAQTVTASDSISSTISGVSGNVIVSAATATHFVVSAAPSSVTAGSAVNVTVTAE